MHESLCIGVCIEVCRECGRRQGVTDHISEAGMYKSTYASESDTYMLGKTAHWDVNDLVDIEGRASYV